MWTGPSERTEKYVDFLPIVHAVVVESEVLEQEPEVMELEV